VKIANLLKGSVDLRTVRDAQSQGERKA